MEWLTTNWTYLLLLIGVILFMRFGGICGGFGCRRRQPGHGLERSKNVNSPGDSTATTDPVSQRPVDPKSAIATIYQGRAYYFESRENRERFEAAPDQYASALKDSQGGGEHRHGGCC